MLLSKKEYCEGDDEELVNKIIFNSPSFIAVLGEKYFMENLYERYKKLLKDPNEEIRMKCAKGIHEIVKIFGTVSSFHNEFDKHVTTLMLDKSVSVLGTLLLNLHEIADVLIPKEMTEEIKENDLDSKISAFRNTMCK